MRLKACRSPLRGKDGRENENRIFVKVWETNSVSIPRNMREKNN